MLDFCLFYLIYLPKMIKDMEHKDILCALDLLFKLTGFLSHGLDVVSKTNLGLSFLPFP